MNIRNCKSSANRLAIAAAAVFLFNYAGGSSAQTGQQDLKAIKQVTLDSQIPQPDIPLIQSPGNFGAYMLGGGIGAAIDQQEAGKLFREYMRRNNIDISKILLESFKRVIEEEKTFELAANADAKLKLAINNYGFGASGFFGGSERRPLMNVTASLVSSDGSVVWKKTEYITNLSKATDVYTYEQLAKDPALTVKSFEQISTLLSRQMLAELKR